MNDDLQPGLTPEEFAAEDEIPVRLADVPPVPESVFMERFLGRARESKDQAASALRATAAQIKQEAAESEEHGHSEGVTKLVARMENLADYLEANSFDQIGGHLAQAARRNLGLSIVLVLLLGVVGGFFAGRFAGKLRDQRE